MQRRSTRRLMTHRTTGSSSKDERASHSAASRSHPFSFSLSALRVAPLPSLLSLIALLFCIHRRRFCSTQAPSPFLFAAVIFIATEISMRDESSRAARKRAADAREERTKASSSLIIPVANRTKRRNELVLTPLEDTNSTATTMEEEPGQRDVEKRLLIDPSNSRVSAAPASVRGATISQEARAICKLRLMRRK